MVKPRFYADNPDNELAGQFDTADNVQDTYYNRENWRYRGGQHGMSSNGGYSRGQSAPKVNKRSNPEDRNGNVMACNFCRSIYHFARQCPELQNRSDQ